MATFYIQLEDRLQKISGDLTHNNIIKALGYTPSDFSGNFNDLIDNPLTQDGNGEFKIVDESGNIIAIVDSEGIHSIDFVAGDHKLSNKADTNWVAEYVTETVTEGKVNLDGYATESWVENKGYAKQEDLDNIDFNTLKNTPFSDDENGELNIVDENNNIGLRLNSDGLYVKDVIAGDNILSNKVDKSDLEGLATEQWVEDKKYLTEHQDISNLATKDEIPSLEGYAKTSDLPNLEPYAKTSWVTEYVTDIVTDGKVNLDGYATEEYVNSKDTAVQQWVNEKGYTTQEDIANIDFYSIKDNPIINDGDGRLVFADENGNIGLQIEADNTIFVKDVIAGDHALTNKMDIVDNLVRVEDTNGEVDDVPEDVCVKYVTQSLTEEQKNQVRENLDIPSMEYVLSLFEQLRQMIENNNASDAIAILDNAILDMHKLQ